MKLKKLLLATLIFAASGYSYAAPGSQPEDPETQEIPERNYGQDPERKRMPSRHSRIFFRYDYLNRWCIFSNLGSSTSMSVTITDLEGNTRFGSVSSDFPIWQIDLQSGEYFIACTSDTGTTYEGFVYI